MKVLSLAILCVGLAISRLAAFPVAAQGAVFQTSVTPLPEEDLASDCRYEITLAERERRIRGVWVIFERGRDMLRMYADPDVQAFARRHDLALLLPFHCRAKSGTDGDLNMDPAKGIGRALLAALGQFAKLSGHQELASAKLILLGFSGTGSLVGRFAAYARDRVLEVVATHPGHNPLGLEQRHYAPATINLRLAAVRRLAYEAAGAGLLSPELAASIRRVKGVRRIGVGLGNWLTSEQGRRLLEHSTPATPRELRDHAMLAALIGCGLRRGELLSLTPSRFNSARITGSLPTWWAKADTYGPFPSRPG